MDAPKINRGRSKKVFACFKPPVVDEPGRDEASPPCSGDDAAAPGKRKLRRSFSAALKAVFFKTSLKKSRSENSKQESYKSRNNIFSKSKRLVNSVKKSLSSTPLEPDVHIFRSNSDRSSLFSSNSSSSRAPSLSSSASSCSSHSRSGSSDKIKRSVSMDFKQMNNKPKTTRKDCGRKSSSCSDYNLTIEIFVVWACLFALIWGKVFAIVICTSSWLFFAPAHRRRHSQRPQPPQKVESFDEMDPEYKKRVIMEGLLDRNR